MSPEDNDKFFGFAVVKEKLFAPRQTSNLCISSCKLTHLHCVVSSNLYDGTGGVDGSLIVSVQRVEKWAQQAALRGDSECEDGETMKAHFKILCVISKKMFNLGAGGGGKSNFDSLSTKMARMMVLKAEL